MSTKGKGNKVSIQIPEDDSTYDHKVISEEFTEFWSLQDGVIRAKFTKFTPKKGINYDKKADRVHKQALNKAKKAEREKNTDL